MRQDVDVDPAERTLRSRLRRLNRVSAVAFSLGGSLFALGALFAQAGNQSIKTVNVTYLVGGFCFSLGGFALILVVNTTINSERSSGSDPAPWWASHPHQASWLSAIVLFGGTLLFAVSLVAAFVQGLTPRQSNGWIWLPDMLGCTCFLVSGHLALRDVRRTSLRTRVHSLDWWVAAVNQIGSVLFFLAGLAAFTRPATSSAVDVGLVNGGTFAGAAFFAVGGVLQVFDSPMLPTTEKKVRR